MKQIITTIIFAILAVAVNCQTNNAVMGQNTAIDTKHMDKSTTPGNNFFKYVNGTWMKENPIPPEYSQYGAFTILYENNQKLLKQLVLDVSEQKDIEQGSVNQKIRDLYNSGMDTIAIE